MSYLKTLAPEYWRKQATPQWTVKDVVAHMLGWEQGDAEAIRNTWKTKTPPWWERTTDYDEFNRQNTERYKQYIPEQLLAEWEQCRLETMREIKRVGENNIKMHPELFRWLLEAGEIGGDNNHAKHHFEQVKKATGKT